MSNKNSSGGVGVLGLLGVVFVALKLTGYIDWSWWYVTMPFWGGFAVLAAVAAICGVVWLIAKLAEGARK
jgi:hypothetical protein